MFFLCEHGFCTFFALVGALKSFTHVLRYHVTRTATQEAFAGVVVAIIIIIVIIDFACPRVVRVNVLLVIIAVFLPDGLPCRLVLLLCVTLWRDCNSCPPLLSLKKR